MSRTNQIPTSIRNIRARLRPFKQPIVWGSLAFLLLLTLCIWEFWQNPQQFLAISMDETSENAPPSSTTTLDDDARRIAADIDTSDILGKLKPPTAVINNTQIQPKPQPKTTSKLGTTPGALENNLAPQPNSDSLPPPGGTSQIPATATPLNDTSFSDSLLGIYPGVGTNLPVIAPTGQQSSAIAPVWGTNSTPPISPLLSAVQQYSVVPGVGYSSNPYTGNPPTIANYGSNPGTYQTPTIPNYGNNYSKNPNTYPVPVLPNYQSNPSNYQQNSSLGNANNLGQQPSYLPSPLPSQQNSSAPVVPGLPAADAPTALPGQTMANEDTTRGFAGTNSADGSSTIPVAPVLDAAPNNAYNYLLQSAPPSTPPSAAVVVPGGVGAAGSLAPGSSNPLDGQPNPVIDNYQNQLMPTSPAPNGVAPNPVPVPLSSPASLPRLESE